MINVKIEARHGRTDKPAGTEYLYQDGHNSKKFHHIIVSDSGQAFYNQTIHYDAIVRNGVEITAETYQDFYEWEKVSRVEKHGYRKHIERAINERVAEQAAPGVGDCIEYWNNQAYRPGNIMAIIGGEALICFEMPAGGEYLHVVKASGLAEKMDYHSGFLRNVSWNRIPKKWAQAAGL